MAARGLGALLIATTVALAACGGSDDRAVTAQPSATPTSSPTPAPVSVEEVLERSGAAMEQVSSFRFRLEHEAGETKLLPGVAINVAEGVVVKPDRLSVDFTGSVGTFVLRASLITIGDSVFMTNPLSGKWETLQVGVGPQGFFDPRQGIAAMLSGVEQASLFGDRDGPVLHVRGQAPTESLSPLLGTVLEGAVAAVELEIDAGSYLFLKVRVEGRVTPSDVEDVVRVITVFNVNEPVKIEPPQ